MVLQALGGDPNLAGLGRVGQDHVAFEQQLVGIAQQLRAIGSAAPVCAFRLDVKLGLEDHGRARGRVVLQPRSRHQQLDAAVGAAEAGAEVGQGVVEPGVGQGRRDPRAAVIGELPANQKHQHQGQAGRQHGAASHR